MLSDNILWVDMGRTGFDLVLASFEDSPEEHAIVIRGDDAYTQLEAQQMASAGFFPMSGPRNVWARRGSSFKMRELRSVFPRMFARKMHPAETLLSVRGASPFTKGSEKPQNPQSTDGVLQPERINQFQSLYKPASKLGTPIAMIPVNMTEPTAKALAGIEDVHGPVDEFVARKLDLTFHELDKVLSPEQIDAVAMGISAMERGREFILADQTGLGKGRVLAALALAAAVENRPVVFISVKSNLFSDFWRDITDIGADKRLSKPFILNNDVKILDVKSINGDILFESEKPDSIKKQMKKGSLPDGSNIMLSTYSQFNRAGSAKSKFLAQIAKGAYIISDEAHEATGDSVTKENLDPAMAVSWGAIRSSATFARRSTALLSYKKVLPPSLRTDEVSDILEMGGLPLAEALSQYLAEDGVLIRREHDLSELNIEVVTDHARKHRNREYADALAPILSRIAKLSRMVDDEIENRNEEAQSGSKSLNEKWYSSSFGARLSPLIRQFIIALEVDICVDRAVQSLIADEKPVIVIESTMESLMRELSADGGVGGGEEGDHLRTEYGETEEDFGTIEGGSPPPDFRAALSLMLERTMTLSVKRGKNDPEKVSVEDPFCLAEADNVKRLIDQFPDLSLSPIDDIIQRIEAEGLRLHEEGLIDRPWRVDEISARKLCVRDGLYEIRPTVDRNETIVSFNNGGIDALILTRAASTGLSLHDAFTDKRRRRMIELQIAANVVERVQFWGRVNRRGQRTVPAFETLCTGLPLQMRIMSMENRKVAALSANVSASAENANSMDVPDLIDSVGNEVAQRLLEERPRLAERMCIAMKVDTDTAEAELYFINKILQRMALLLSVEQDEIFERLVADYEEAISSLKAKGRTPRGIRELDGVWTEISRELYEEGDAADGPVFGRSVEIVTMEGRFEKTPITSMRVHDLIVEARKRLSHLSGNAAGPFFENEIKAIKSNRRKVLNASLAGRFISVDSALATPGPNAVKNADERMKGLISALTLVQPGLSISVPKDESESVTATIVDVRAPDVDEVHLPGRWAVRYAIPGEAHPKEISIATLLKDKSYILFQSRPGQIPEPRLEVFDQAPSGIVTETRRFLDGNLVKAVAIAAEARSGSMVAYNDTSGNRKRSVLISKNGYKLLFDRSRKIKSSTEGFNILDSEQLLYSNHLERQNGIIIEKIGSYYSVVIPRGKGGKKFETPSVLSICGIFRDQAGSKTARIGREQIVDLIDSLVRDGISLHYDPPQGVYQPIIPPKKRQFGSGKPLMGLKR